ncbi:MAG: methyltransferase domain-containing protein [Saprospiraceae bacterium]
MKESNQFTSVPFTINNLDVYHVRNGILNSLKASITLFNNNFLDVGCGNKPYKKMIMASSTVTNYIGLDLEDARDYGTEKADIFWTSDGLIPLEAMSVQSAMATEVLEHCPDPQSIINEVFRVLDQNGIFFITVPFIWNLHEVPHDEYRYTPFSLERILKNAGFSSIVVKAHGGWNASLGLMLSLWCRRYWKNNYLKFIFSLICYPIIGVLYTFDTPPLNFKEGVMITGLSIIAKK